MGVIYMSIVTGENVGRSYGDFDVFKNLTFSIEHGDRIGLVGPNGEGKLRCCAYLQPWMSRRWDGFTI